jgi:hypothetical protein
MLEGHNYMAGKKLQVVVEAFRAYILQNGWSIVLEREIANGLQLVVTDGITRVPIDCYTNGNALIQGATGSLRATLQEWWKLRKSSAYRYSEALF